jgi:putative ABC transport system permease protein
MSHTPALLAKALADEIPEIEYAASVLPASWFPYKGIASNNDVHIKAGGEYISKNYFDVFSVDFTEGDKNKVVNDKSSVAISEDMAMKLFHSKKNVTGKILQWTQQEFGGSFIVSGVFKKPPATATDQYDLMFNYDILLEKRPYMLEWDNSDPNTYVILKEGANISQVNNKIKTFIETKHKKAASNLFLAKYSDNYLHGKYENGKQVGGRIVYVKLFSIIAIFILLIACINFMNLSTAKASRRIKEVGIKKVMGAQRGTLVLQYIGESMMMTFLSLILAVIMIYLLLPAFNELAGKQLSLHIDLKFIGIVSGIVLLTGLIAGSYPAFYISGFKPIAVLKGKLRVSFGELWVRKGLVVFQFTLSVIFIAAVLIVYRQLDYIQSKNLGYSRDNIIHFEIPFDIDSAKLSHASAFVNELKNIPGVINSSSYYHNLTGDHGGVSGFEWPGKVPGTDVDIANLEVGYNFLETMGIKIKEGRNFSQNDNASKEIVFNESAIKSMGIKDPIGKMVKFWGQERQIVGVAADFNFESLYQTVKPCFFQVYPALPNVMAKIKSGTEKQTIDRIRKAFTGFSGGMTFDYQFLDKDYQALYVSEQKVGLLSRYFAGLAIIISCLGLFGLAAFTAQRRQKEIGIRKVVGASVQSVAFLLSKEFLKLVFVAMIIAFPLVWWVMNNWLDDFAYRINISADVFVITGVSAILITVLTISFQSIKAAIANPVKSLRSE